MHHHEFIKLQPGNYIVCNEDHLGQFTKGKYYEVLKIWDYGPGDIHNSIDIVSDDSGNKNGWGMEKFDLLPVSKAHIPARYLPQNTAQNEPQETPKPHSRSDAIWELLKMAAKQ